jgi:DNA primase
VFHKGKELYGLHLALDAIHHEGSAIVVEGYMDVIALAQAGIENSVAALGTATTTAHIERLFRHCNSIVFCFDGDRAGRQAAWRALENALPSLRDGRQASFMFLPQGEDPDTQVRRLGREAFLQQLVQQAMPLPEYMLDHLSDGIDLQRMDGKARLAGLARPLLGKLPSGTLRDLLTQRLAEMTGVDSERLQDMLDEPPETIRSRPAVPPRPESGRQTLISRLLRHLLNEPTLAMTVDDMALLRKLELAGMDVLCRIIDTIQSRPDLTISAIIERFRGTPYYERLCELAGSPTGLDETAANSEFGDAIDRLRLMAIDQETGKLTARSTKLSEDDKTELRRLQKQRLALKQ